MRAVLNLLRLVQEFVPWPHVVEQADHVDITHSNLFSGDVSEGWTTLLKSKSSLDSKQLHVIRNSTGNEVWSIYNDTYFDIWTFFS